MLEARFVEFFVDIWAQVFFIQEQKVILWSSLGFSWHSSDPGLGIKTRLIVAKLGVIFTIKALVKYLFNSQQFTISYDIYESFLGVEVDRA